MQICPQRFDFSENDYASLCQRICDGSLLSEWTEDFSWEKRYWKVDINQNAIIKNFHACAIQDYFENTGESPVVSFVMANRVSPSKEQYGSGGGWHADSFSNQYKAFLYLSPVDESNGPFEYIHRSWMITAMQLLHRIVKRNNRYTPIQIESMRKISVLECVLGGRMTYFFSKTNMPHRGSPAVSAERLALTCYMFDKQVKKWDR